MLGLLVIAAALSCVAANKQAASLYSGDFKVTDISGKEFDMASLEGKVSLIVNVASQCGYTDQNYRELQEAYGKYQEYGFEVLAFPCNQFGGQEPGDAAQITSFVTKKYKVSFPLMSKVEVNGAGQHPVFAWLKANGPPAPGRRKGDAVNWNFEKWLVNKSGQVVKHYGSEIDLHELETDIYNELVKDDGSDEEL